MIKDASLTEPHARMHNLIDGYECSGVKANLSSCFAVLTLLLQQVDRTADRTVPVDLFTHGLMFGTVRFRRSSGTAVTLPVTRAMVCGFRDLWHVSRMREGGNTTLKNMWHHSRDRGRLHVEVMVTQDQPCIDIDPFYDKSFGFVHHHEDTCEPHATIFVSLYVSRVLILGIRKQPCRLRVHGFD